MTATQAYQDSLGAAMSASGPAEGGFFEGLGPDPGLNGLGQRQVRGHAEQDAR